MATLSQIVPREVDEVDPFDDMPEVKLTLAHVDSKKLDIITSKSQIEIRKNDGRGRIEKEKVFSNDRAARVYAEEVFLDFKGITDSNGKEVENTLENRIMLLQKSNTLLNFIVQYASDDANFTEKSKREDEEDFSKISQVHKRVSASSKNADTGLVERK
jgi:hypothetical protein